MLVNPSQPVCAHSIFSLQVASSVEDLNNHCIAFCKDFHVEVLKPSRVSCFPITKQSHANLQKTQTCLL